ncbi:MAG: hypothetical protein ACKO4N_06560 [Verrucomicrobiota bacterium]
MRTIHGSPSHVLVTPEAEVAVTETAGHLAPVTFHLTSGDFSPYSLSPWTPEDVDASLPPLLVHLRGDFLCLPFGGQESGPPHGDVANARWTLKSSGPRHLSLEQKGADTGAAVTKTLSVEPGHHVVYVEHLIHGLEGRWNYGTHPILDLSKLPEGAARVSIGPFRWGSVYHKEFSDPAAGERGALKPGARFSDLSKVPMKEGSTADLTRYPARKGNDDLVMMVSEPETEKRPFGWSAVSFPGAVWFALKNVADFPSTLFWISNGGRPGAPWNGRHLGRLGIEEVCSHFCDGVADARKDLLAGDGIPTSRAFRPIETVRLPMIQGAAAVPSDFGLVTSISADGPAHIRIESETGQSVRAPVNWKFLKR